MEIFEFCGANGSADKYICGAARVIGSWNSMTNLFASFAKSDKLGFKGYIFFMSV